MLSPTLLLPRSLKTYAAFTVLSVLLAGCAAIQTESAQEQTTPVARHYHEAIALSGRLSILYSQNNQPQSLHGSFTWDQQQQHIVLSLLSPLGQTLAVIDSKPGVAILTQSGKAPLAADDVDLLVSQALGWPLPVSGLREWLQGFGERTDGSPFVAHPSREPSRFTTRDGWALSYVDWQDDAANTARNRPKRIDLMRQTEQAGLVSIRIVISEWQTSDPPDNAE